MILSDPTRVYVPNVEKLQPHIEKAPQQWPTHVHQVWVSGTMHGHQEKISGSEKGTRHPVHHLWRENITEYTQVTDLK